MATEVGANAGGDRMRVCEGRDAGQGWQGVAGEHERRRGLTAVMVTTVPPMQETMVMALPQAFFGSLACNGAAAASGGGLAPGWKRLGARWRMPEVIH